MIIVTLLLIKTPLLGGLKEREREVLKQIYLNKEIKNRYKIMKELRKNYSFSNLGNKQIYRIFNRLCNFGYIEYNSEKNPILTELGLSTIKILTKSVNNV